MDAQTTTQMKSTLDKYLQSQMGIWKRSDDDRKDKERSEQ